nr:hypothetical protein [Tanacetum cinerariifolium]
MIPSTSPSASTSSSINLTSVSSLVIRRSKASKSDLIKGWVGKTVVGVVAPFDRSGDPDDVVMEELKDEDSDLETESFLWLLDRNIFFGLILAESFMIFGKRNEKNMEKWRLLLFDGKREEGVRVVIWRNQRHWTGIQPHLGTNDFKSIYEYKAFIAISRRRAKYG